MRLHLVMEPTRAQTCLYMSRCDIWLPVVLGLCLFDVPSFVSSMFGFGSVFGQDQSLFLVTTAAGSSSTGQHVATHLVSWWIGWLFDTRRYVQKLSLTRHSPARPPWLLLPGASPRRRVSC